MHPNFKLSTISTRWGWLLVFIAGVLLLPLAGLLFVSGPRDIYFAFPPPTSLYVEQAVFSWLGFVLTAFAIALGLVLLCWVLGPFRICAPETSQRKLPRWGSAAGTALILCWILAWTRSELFSPLQQHSFVLLWMNYIVFANAVLWKLRGSSPLTSQPKSYALLFVLSAVFWWLFEWLNRFVQNWIYHNVEDFTAAGYFLFATLSFSTVLPSIYVTKLLLAGITEAAGPERTWRLKSVSALCASTPMILAAISILVLLPVFPSLLFPSVWLSPLLLFPAARRLGVKSPACFDALESWQWMLAGLSCGLFWELWNWKSLTKWVYHVAHVEAFHIFEMPLVGYAGYLPFGILCGLVTKQFLAEFNATSEK